MDLRIFERMVDDLNARGISAAGIKTARAMWSAMPDGRLPCPMCLLQVRGGRLGAQPTLFGVDRLKCDLCEETIELSPR